MKKCGLVYILAVFGIASSLCAATYSTDAAMSLEKEECIYNVMVKVSELTEQDGKVTERSVAEPRIRSAPGVPASVYMGSQPGDADYAQSENVAVDVSWPYPNESGIAACVVTVKRGDAIVSKSKFQLRVDGPGRVPLILPIHDVAPRSVKVVKEKSGNFVLLELVGKSKEDVKKLAAENYGNKVQIRDGKGNLREGGRAFGTYQEIGLCLECKDKNEAEQIAKIFRAGTAK